MMRSALAAVSLAAAGIACPTLAHPATEKWRAVSAETGQVRDVEGLEQLSQDFPDSGTVRLRLLNAQLQNEDVEGAMATLEWLYDRGYVFGEVPQSQIPKLLAGVDPGRIAERLIAEAEVIEASEVIATVPEIGGLVESVVRDPKANRLIASSVSEKGILGKRSYGDWDGFQPEGVANLSGIALDSARGFVWFGAGQIDGSEDAPDLFRGLLGISLEGRVEKRIAAPVDVSISDIALGQYGVIYGSDPIGGGIYHAASDDAEMSALIGPGTFRSPQGLALSADGKKLYLSDYRYGIAIIDISTRKVSRLASDIPVILDGVDGLWRYGNELIAVQNGTSPMRITAFELSEDGMSVIGHRILEQANPEWTEPLSGSIDGDSLIYIGNGQWDRFVAGEPAQDKPALPTQIRKLPID